MAEPSELVSIIQEVIDGRVDLQSFEEFMNAAKDVVIARRLAGGVNSLDHYLDYFNAIKLVFTQENGSVTVGDKTVKSLSQMMLDAAITLERDGGYVPYPSYDAMVADAANITNKMILEVTNDNDQLLNGKYTYDGVSVFTESNYDVLALAKADATNKVDAALVDAKKYTADNIMPSDLALELVPMNEEARGQYTIAGVFTASEATITSQKIPVKAGECYVLRNMRGTDISVNSIVLFDEANNFVGVIAHNRVDAPYYATEQGKFEMGVGLYSQESDLYSSGAIIPSDGFIQVSYQTNGSINPTNISALPPTLYKTDYNGFIKLTTNQASDEVMAKFDRIFKSVKIDKSLADNVGIGYTQTVGSPVVFNTEGYNASERMAVNVGEFIHVQTISNAGYATVVFEDEAGNYLGQQSIISEHTLRAGDAPILALNIKSKYSGFFRVQQQALHSIPFLVGLTKGYVSYPRNYLTRTTTALEFHPSLGSDRPVGVSETYNGRTVNNTLNRTNSTVGLFTSSIPYILKAGDVLQYELEATSAPLLMFATPCDVQLDTAIDQLTAVEAIKATEVISIEQIKAWSLAGKPNSPDFYANASKGTIAYCNEDMDMSVIFLRPNKLGARYSTYKQNQGYKLSLHTKDEYKAIRNRELGERFKQFSGFKVRATPNIANEPIIATDEYMGVASFPPVLMFKGEVINYLANGYVNSSVASFNEITGLKRKEQIVSDIGASYARQYSLGEYAADYMNLPVKTTNPLSYFINQVYAHETAQVFLGLNYFNSSLNATLDVDGILSNGFFEPRILDLKEAVINDNLIPYMAYGVNSEYDAPVVDGYIGGVNPSFTGSGDSIVTFAPAGASLEATYWGNLSSHIINKGNLTPVVGQYLPVANLTPIFNMTNDDGVYERTDGASGLCKIGTTTTEPSLITTFSGTVRRDRLSMVQNGSQTALDVTETFYKFMPLLYKHELKVITAQKVIDEYTVTDKKFFAIPDIGAITFEFCTPVSESLVESMYTMLQIRVAGEVVIVLNALTANQGQSSASLERKNVNIEFYNDKFDEVYIKFADAIEQSEVVLKSYYITDKGHYRDTVATDFWYKIRNAEPYPIGGVMPKSVFNNLTIPTNQVARASTFAFPVEKYNGGEFYSIATMRFKKKRENYGMVKSNHNHILIQADWLINGPIDWTAANMGNFEIRNPKMSKYVEGSAVLPTGFEDVQANTIRIIDWMRGVYNGEINARDTYKSFVNLDSLLDYCLSMWVTWNWDGVANNFIMGTHDSQVWDFYSYDTDQSWGSRSFGNKINFMLMDTGHFFAKIMDVFAAEAKAKYSRLRDLGVINARSIQDSMVEEYSQISSHTRKKDAEYWGALLEAEGLPYSMEWVFHRIRFLDFYYGYKERFSTVLVQWVRENNTIEANGINTFSYTNTDAIVGEVLTVEYGVDLTGTTITAECLVAGKIVVKHKNLTASPITNLTSYIRVYRGY